MYRRAQPVHDSQNGRPHGMINGFCVIFFGASIHASKLTLNSSKATMMAKNISSIGTL
jgi:hypothetical protein